ncbi:MAG: hypothetical protein H0W44_00620 [Gammaproteobacteria bacterium]|nr:hypothetical protein [Gammaproteobacteria bacterium]
MPKKISDLVLLIIFSSFLWLPLYGFFIADKKIYSPNEKRTLAQKPEFSSIKTLDFFVKDYTSYFNDHFGYRERLVGSYNKVLNLLGVSSTSKKVIEGKNGWYFYAGDAVIDQYSTSFTEDELQKWAQHLEQKRQWLEQRGIVYLFVIPPNSHTIYSEFMPDWFLQTKKESRKDQLLSYLQKHTKVDVLDLAPALLEVKKSTLVYYKTDTHWNRLGASVARYEIEKKLHQRIPSISPASYLNDDFIWSPRPESGDLAVMLGLDKNIREDAPFFDNPKMQSCDQNIPVQSYGFKFRGLPPQATECDGQLKLLIFHDSYAYGLEALALNFKKVVYLWRFADDMKVLEHYVNVEKPDVVIEERVERFLSDVP